MTTPEHDDEEAIRQRSGDIQSDDPLVSFLYDLMRDHVPVGVVETLVSDAMQVQKGGAYYTNGWLAQYAIDAAKRLRT